MRYQLERQERIIKPTAVYSRTAQSVIDTYRWKGVVLSDNAEILKEYAGNKGYRIIDKTNGSTIWQTIENIFPF